MASAWGDSWGTSWADSWGQAAVAPPVAVPRFIGAGAGRSYPLVGFVSVDEQPDTLEALLVMQEATLDLVELDNSFLLLAAA